MNQQNDPAGKACFRMIQLPNGLVLHVYDTSRRYYGDYHLVRLEIVCEVAMQEDFFTDPNTFAEAIRLLGDSIVYRRNLERMGVPHERIDAARTCLMDGFEKTALGYFASEGFSRRLALSQFTRARGESNRSFT